MLLRLATAVLATVLLVAPTRADEVADFYKGLHPSRWSSDTGRAAATASMRALLARHMGRHIPGNPGPRRAEHAGCRQSGGGQPSRQRRREGRYGDRNLRSQNLPLAQRDRCEPEHPSFDARQAHLARLGFELRRRRLHSVGAAWKRPRSRPSRRRASRGRTARCSRVRRKADTSYDVHGAAAKYPRAQHQADRAATATATACSWRSRREGRRPASPICPRWVPLPYCIG